MQLSLLALFASACLAVVFVASAGAKTRDGLAFALSIRQLLGLRLTWARPLARAVIAGEFAVAGLVVFGPTRPLGLGLATVLLAAFTVVLAHALRQGLSISCRCFGRSSTSVRPHHLVRNALLIGVATIGLVSSLATDSSSAESVVVAVVLGATIGLVITLWDDLVEILLPKPTPSTRTTSHSRSSP